MIKKKINTLFLIILILTGSFSASCGQKAAITATPMELMTKIVDLFPEIPPAKTIYYEGTGEFEKGYFDPEFAGYLYTGKYHEDFKELDKLESYAVRIPDGKSVFEIHILKVKDPSDADSIAGLCRERISILKTGDVAEYDPESFYKIIEKSEVYTAGNYIFLLSTTDNDAVKAVLN